MGAGGNLFGRAISYVVNELVVEGLANKAILVLMYRKLLNLVDGQAFQRFAVKTNRTLQDLTVKAEASKRVLMEQVKNTVESSSRNQRS